MLMNILFAWEWGAGVSHLLRFRPLADELVRQGHRVVLAVRDLGAVRRYYGDDYPAIYQSPTLTGSVTSLLDLPRTMADLAWNLGYDRPERIRAQVEAYLHLLRVEAIDVVVSDFGLSASIAARRAGLRRIRIGTGFECPPLTNPLTNLAHSAPDPTADSGNESVVLASINQTLERIGGKPLEHFHEAIGDPGASMIASLKELDPYQDADGREYLGTWETSGGGVPVWPSGSGPKVIAYLKPFPALPAVVRGMSDFGCRVALVADGIPQRLMNDFGPQVAVQDGPVDLSLAAQECDFAVANSNHGMSIRMLSLGIPLIGFPTFFEQHVHARCMADHRLALAMSTKKTDRLEHAMSRAMSVAAKRHVNVFADRYRAFLDGSLSRAMNRLLHLIN